MTNEKLFEKLHKILAMTTVGINGAATEVEAQAAAGHLARLLEEHNLGIADLERKGQKTPGVREDKHDLGKAAFKWKLDLAEAIASHYYCHPLVCRTEKTVAFIGRPDNVESLQMLYAWLIDQIKRIAAEERKSHHARTGEHIDPLRWQVSFGVGAVERLGERLEERKREREQTNDSGSTALVLHHATEISDYLEERFGYRTDGKRTKREQARHDRDARLDELRKTDIEAFYRECPWERPLTPEQKAARDAQNEKWQKEENARRRRNERARERRGGGYGSYRERTFTAEDLRKLEQSRLAKRAGLSAADRVNLEPFLTGKQEARAVGGKK